MNNEPLFAGMMGAIVGSVFMISIGISKLESTLEEWHEEWVECCMVSDPPKDTRPEIPDCGMSTWDEIRGECNETG